MRTVTASQTVDVSTSFSSSPKSFTECPYTYTPTIDPLVTSAFSYATDTKLITLDTVTTDSIDHIGTWDIVVAPTTPYTGTQIVDRLTLTVTVLEPCDPPQMSFFASALLTNPVEHERQFVNTPIDISELFWHDPPKANSATKDCIPTYSATWDTELDNGITFDAVNLAFTVDTTTNAATTHVGTHTVIVTPATMSTETSLNDARLVTTFFDELVT